MKALAAVLQQFSAPLAMVEFDVPALQEGQVLVEVLAAGICRNCY